MNLIPSVFSNEIFFNFVGPPAISLDKINDDFFFNFMASFLKGKTIFDSNMFCLLEGKTFLDPNNNNFNIFFEKYFYDDFFFFNLLLSEDFLSFFFKGDIFFTGIDDLSLEKKIVFFQALIQIIFFFSHLADLKVNSSNIDFSFYINLKFFQNLISVFFSPAEFGLSTLMDEPFFHTIKSFLTDDIINNINQIIFFFENFSNCNLFIINKLLKKIIIFFKSLESSLLTDFFLTDFNLKNFFLDEDTVVSQENVFNFSQEIFNKLKHEGANKSVSEINSLEKQGTLRKSSEDVILVHQKKENIERFLAQQEKALQAVKTKDYSEEEYMQYVQGLLSNLKTIVYSIDSYHKFSKDVADESKRILLFSDDLASKYYSFTNISLSLQSAQEKLKVTGDSIKLPVTFKEFEVKELLKKEVAQIAEEMKPKKKELVQLQQVMKKLTWVIGERKKIVEKSEAALQEELKAIREKINYLEANRAAIAKLSNFIFEELEGKVKESKNRIKQIKKEELD